MAINDLFGELEGGAVPPVPTFGQDDFAQGGTNIPRPVDITGNVTDAFTPQAAPQSSTGQFLDTLDPNRVQQRKEQQSQQAIDAFGQAQLTPPSTTPTAPSRDATGIPSAPQAVPPLYPTPEMGTLAGQGVTAPQVTPQFTPQGPTEVGAQGLPTPTISENQQIDTEMGVIADKMGLTGDERDRFIREQGQQNKIASAKQGIAGRTIIKSLREQGMEDIDIKKAIGADQNPNMSKSQAVTKLKELQNKKQMQGASTKIAKQSERIEKEAEYNEDGSPANTEAKWSNIEAELATTGDDPLGEPLSSFLSEADKRLINNTRGKVASGASTGGGMKRVNKILMDAKKKSTRTRLNREAKEAKSKATIQEKNIESLIKNRDDRKVYQEEKAKRDALYKTWQGMLKTDFAGTAEETRLAKEAFENFPYSFEGQGNVLTPELAKQFKDAAGGDRAKAEENARNAGYTW